jgi:predicted ribosome quality control (RQC) complex YloA/Tae2 family protein
MPITAAQLKKYLPFLKGKLIHRHISSPILFCENTLFFRLSGEGPRRLVICLDDNNPRFYVALNNLDATSLDSKFLDQLKKELNNAFVVGISQVEEDRVVSFDLTIISQVFKEEKRKVFLELIPHHANLIVADSEETILTAFRPGEMSDERPLLRGLKYQKPIKKDFVEKDEPFDEKAFLSECLAQEKALEEKRKKDRFGFLLLSLKKKEKLLERKMIFIQSDIEEAKKHLDDGRLGDIIYMAYPTIKPKSDSFEYEGEVLKLDPSRSVSKNAELYYKRAKKSKETIVKGEANCLSAKKDLESVKSALEQIQAADERGLEELSKELGILAPLPSQKKPRGDWHGLSSESLPSFIDFHGTKILFGRSAKQNDCLTFLFDTVKEHYWLHILGNTGSHVMIKRENPSSEEIQAAAELALICSNQADGEVMVTKRESVRKGNVMGQAIVKEFKTLRINSVTPEIRNLAASAQKAKF